MVLSAVHALLAASVIRRLAPFPTPAYWLTANATMPKSFMTPPGAVPERVSLSKKQQRILTDMADAIIAETLQTDEMFVSNGRQLPNDQWKHVKSKEKVHVYRSRHSKGSLKPRGQSQDEKDPSRPRLLSLSAMERHERENSGRPYVYADEESTVLEEKDSVNTHSSSSDDGSFSLADDCVLSKVKPSHVPLVVATGVIDGTVEDVAFGGFANTRKSWITRKSYVHNDVFDDRKVLATLQLPSEEDPFRSVTIKWATGNYGAFTTRRDFLVQKKLTIDVTKEILQKNFTFCLSCVIEAKELSAWELAMEAVRRSQP
ncbi:hypothetical protein JG687_00009525 [Phytophthora cactorum]|uniref:Uncharacterized protein n=1 Tax=Phytophthora cactorum TaxID=29920 RepID=A0A8T1UEC2_9STRA|nr:hypothetical protein JG687_00009525 [Phytophthora cactorum]